MQSRVRTPFGFCIGKFSTVGKLAGYASLIQQISRNQIFTNNPPTFNLFYLHSESLTDSYPPMTGDGDPAQVNPHLLTTSMLERVKLRLAGPIEFDMENVTGVYYQSLTAPMEFAPATRHDSPVSCSFADARALVIMDQNLEYSEWESAQPTFVRSSSACEVAFRCWKLSHEFLNVSHDHRDKKSNEQFSTRWAQTVVGRLPKRDSLAHKGFRSCTQKSWSDLCGGGHPTSNESCEPSSSTRSL